MKLKYSLFLLLIAVHVHAQLPSTTLRVVDVAINAPNQFQFTLYLKNTSSGNIEFAGGQFHFSFNKALLNGGAGTMTIVSSGLGALAPKNPAVVTSTTPGQLRTAAPTPPGAGSGFILVPGDSVKVATFRVATSAASLAAAIHDLVIRNSTSGNPFSKFGAYIGGINTEIQNASTYYNYPYPGFFTPTWTVNPTSLTQLCFSDTAVTRMLKFAAQGDGFIPVSITIQSAQNYGIVSESVDTCRGEGTGITLPWLTLSDSVFSLVYGSPVTIGVTFHPGNVPPGLYRAILKAESPYGNKSIPVQMELFLPDSIPPVITLRPLRNISAAAVCTLSGVMITDGISGVDTAAGKRPRLYYKKAQNQNVFINNLNTSDGWKWSETLNAASPYSFVLEYARIFGGLPIQGDTIQYFVTAQDRTPFPNVSAAPLQGFAAANVGTIHSAPAAPYSYRISDAALSGTYVISAGFLEEKNSESPQNGTFTSLTQAVHALNERGLQGHVTFVLRDSLYSAAEQFPITIDFRATQHQTSALRTLTIKPADGKNVVVRAPSAAAAVMKFVNADFITISGAHTVSRSARGFTFERAGTSQQGALLWFSTDTSGESCDNNIVKNCNLFGDGITGADYGIVFSGAAPHGVSPGNGNVGNILESNAFGWLETAIFAAGPAASLDSNTVIQLNTIGLPDKPIREAGIALRGQKAPLISKNKIQHISNQSGSGDVRGVFLENTINAAIENNLIMQLRANAAAEGHVSAIEIINTGLPTETQTENRIVNNMIASLSSHSAVSPLGCAGIFLLGGKNDKIFYNTVHLNGDTLGYSANTISGAFVNGFGQARPDTCIEVTDNIFSLSGTTHLQGKLFAHFTTAQTYLGSAVNYNCLYSVQESSGTPYIGFLGTPCSSLAQWQVLSNTDFHSVSRKVFTASPTDLHLSAASIGDKKLRGTPAFSVSKDFDGETRHVYYPYMGADEIPGVPLYQALTLTVFIEGFYTHLMRPDSIRVQLRKKEPPFTVTDSAKVFLNTNGVAYALFEGESNVQDSVYIVIRHRNSIETWSKSPVSFSSGILSYDFSSGASTAYGDNLKLKGTKYCIYSGDVDQDGWIGFSDLIAVDNAIRFGMAGYVPADVNGDFLVDFSDMIIVDNNATAYIGCKSPLSQTAAQSGSGALPALPAEVKQQPGIKKESIEE